jgi:hypothetical protein
LHLLKGLLTKTATMNIDMVFCLCSFRQAGGLQMNLTEMVSSSFAAPNQLVACDLQRGRTFNSNTIVRGWFPLHEIGTHKECGS